MSSSSWYKNVDGSNNKHDSKKKKYGPGNNKYKGARDAHTLGKERRQRYYQNAKTIANYRKIVKEVEESEKHADGSTKRHIEAYKNVFSDSVNKEKRYHGNNNSKKDDEEGNKKSSGGRFGRQTRRATGKKRPNPFQRELTAKAKLKEEKLKQQEDAKQQKHEAERVTKRRKRESKNHRKRTKHGQPIMKYQMGSILEKIEKQYGNNGRKR